MKKLLSNREKIYFLDFEFTFYYLISKDAQKNEAQTECDILGGPINSARIHGEDVKKIASGGQSSIYSCSNDYIVKIYSKPWTIDFVRQEIILKELNDLKFTAIVKVRDPQAPHYSLMKLYHIGPWIPF